MSERGELDALRALRAARATGDERAELDALRAVRAARQTAVAAPAPAPTGLLGEIDRTLGEIGRAGQRGVAATLGAPVDLVNAGLGAIGVPVSDTPLGGRQSLESLLRMFEDPVLAAATGASVAVPPLAPALAMRFAAPAIARLGVTAPSAIGKTLTAIPRFAPNVGAVAGGAGAAGAAEEAARGGGLLDIGEAALRSGLEMGGAEIAGLGLGAAGARLVAPAAGKVSDLGRQALEFARRATPEAGAQSKFFTGRSRGLPIAPGDVASTNRAAIMQTLAEGFLPSRAGVVKKRQKAVVERLMEIGPDDDLNEPLRKLIMADTKEVSLPRAGRVADVVSNALGRNATKRLKLDFSAPRTAMFDLVTKHPEAAAALRKRLTEERFDDLLAASLERLLSSSSREVNGRRVIDGEKLLSTWRDLPDATKNLFPMATREGIEGLGAYAAISKEVPRRADQPASAAQVAATSATGGVPIISRGLGAATATFGTVSLGSSVLLARSLMDSKGFLNRWFVNEKLPRDVLRVLGRQAATTDVRTRARGSLQNN